MGHEGISCKIAMMAQKEEKIEKLNSLEAMNNKAFFKEEENFNLIYTAGIPQMAYGDTPFQSICLANKNSFSSASCSH